MTATARAAAAERLSGATLDTCHVRELQWQLARLQAGTGDINVRSLHILAPSFVCAIPCTIFNVRSAKKTKLIFSNYRFVKHCSVFTSFPTKTLKTHFKLTLKSFDVLIFCSRNL